MAHLGVELGDSPVPNTAMEVIPHPEVLQQLGVDLISVKLGPPKQAPTHLPRTTTDAWGISRRLVRQKKGQLYEQISNPLAKATVDDLKTYPWPGELPSEAAAATRIQARQIRVETDLALVGRFGGPILEIAAGLLGMEEWYIRLASDPDFIAVLLDRISDICTAHDILGIEAAGEFLQIMKVSGEDFGAQTGPLYSLAMFKELLLPPLNRRWQAVRRKLDDVNPEAKIMLHSCGAIRQFLPDIIATGAIDIIDPVQPAAIGMQPVSLHEEFGDNLVFHGGVDVQNLLPFASPDEVRSATIKCMEGFQADKGGFILAPSHTVQADVPPENLLVMVNAAQSWPD